MAEATFKDVPELFEVCGINLLYSVILTFGSGRTRGGTHGKDRKPWYVRIGIATTPEVNAGFSNIP
jgi:hypothetical protein